MITEETSAIRKYKRIIDMIIDKHLEYPAYHNKYIAYSCQPNHIKSHL